MRQLTLTAACAVGGVAGSHKLKRTAVLGFVLLAAAAALVWVVVGVPPVSRGVRSFASLFR